MKGEYTSYVTKTEHVLARQVVEEVEHVSTYSGVVVPAYMGDYVVIDNLGKVIVYRQKRFERRYVPAKKEGV